MFGLKEKWKKFKKRDKIVQNVHTGWIKQYHFGTCQKKLSIVFFTLSLFDFLLFCKSQTLSSCTSDFTSLKLCILVWTYSISQVSCSSVFCLRCYILPKITLSCFAAWLFLFQSLLSCLLNSFSVSLTRKSSSLSHIFFDVSASHFSYWLSIPQNLTSLHSLSPYT